MSNVVYLKFIQRWSKNLILLFELWKKKFFLSHNNLVKKYESLTSKDDLGCRLHSTECMGRVKIWKKSKIDPPYWGGYHKTFFCFVFVYSQSRKRNGNGKEKTIPEVVFVRIFMLSVSLCGTFNRFAVLEDKTEKRFIVIFVMS